VYLFLFNNSLADILVGHVQKLESEPGLQIRHNIGHTHVQVAVGQVRLSVVIIASFLGAFSELREATVSCSCLPVVPHGTTRLPLGELSRNSVYEYFRKFVKKNQFSLKSNKNNGCFT
jgi:hypothetical protein